MDAWADEALKYATGITAELLKSLKFWFGTEFESKTPQEQHALLWGDEDSTEDSYKELELDRGDSQKTDKESDAPGWNTEAEAGARSGSRSGRRGGRSRGRGSEPRDWFEIPPGHLEAMETIEAELQRGGINPRDYRFAEHHGKFVGQRDNTFDPSQRDPHGRTNVKRMAQGLAPLDREGIPLHMHHANQRNDGPLIEMAVSEHIQVPVNRQPSEINRAEHAAFRSSYWKTRAKRFQIR